MANVNFLAQANEILKTTYLPLFKDQINTDASFILPMIDNKGYDGSEIIEGTAQIGLSGGFGYGDLTGYNVPRPDNIQRKKFRVSPTEYFVPIVVVDRLIRSGKSGGALLDYLVEEIEGAYETAKWNLGRSIYGNGTGVLATIGNAVSASTTLEVDSAKYLKEGLTIDIYPSGAAVGSTPTVKQARIIAIEDRRSSAPKVILDQSVTVAADSFVTVQNSYGHEIVGIGTVFDDTVEEICGISKEDYPFVKPTVIDAGKDLTDTVLTQALRSSKDHNGEINVIAMGTSAYDTYVEYLKANNIRLEESKNNAVGGMNTIKFRSGNKLIDIYEEDFVPDAEIWGIDTNAIEGHMTELDYAQAAPEAPAFQLVPGTSTYQALLCAYGNYIYKNPGSFFRIKNCCD